MASVTGKQNLSRPLVLVAFAVILNMVGLAYSDLEVWYDLEVDARDALSNCNGTFVNGAHIVMDDQRGQVLEAICGAITANYNQPGTGTTTAMWFKTTDPNVGLYQALGKKSSDKDIFMGGPSGKAAPGQVCSFLWANGPGSWITSPAGINYADGKWHHVARTLGKGGHKLFMDGVFVASDLVAAVDDWKGVAIKIGESGSFNCNCFSGRLDDVQFYDQELNPNEIEVIAGQKRSVEIERESKVYKTATIRDKAEAENAVAKSFSVSQAAEMRKSFEVIHPQFNRGLDTTFQFDGFLSDYLLAISNNWLKVIPDRNSAIWEMFADREKKPGRSLMPWSGEFAGKYLTGAVQVMRLTRDKELEDYLANFVNRLIELQAEDGYLGPWPKEYRLTGRAPEPSHPMTWDLWNHYHIMLGLILWYEETGDEKAFNVARKIADLLCDTFLGEPGNMASTNEPYVNLSPLHSLCLLYKSTGDQRYLALSRQIIEKEFTTTATTLFQQEIMVDYLRMALAGKEFYQISYPRWESLHTLMGLAEMYWITGEENYRKAFESFWWSIVKLDRHNTGGFSSGEQAKGNPYDPGAIETCCTIAWTAMSVDMLRLTGNSIVADELELTFMNAILGCQPRGGGMCTYNTPMNGSRVPFTTEITGHMRPGSEEISCCTVNAARGFGMISDWALMTDSEGLVLNWYGSSKIITTIKGIPIILEQETDYPRTGHIKLKILPSKAVNFPLKLRIPYWSRSNCVAVNGQLIKEIKSGSYVRISREWMENDTIEIELDMSLHYWVGERDCQGQTSIYYGPVLLAFNPRNESGKINFSKHWKREGSIYRTNGIGAVLEYSFEGDTIHLAGIKSDDAGIAQIKIDGITITKIDQYFPRKNFPLDEIQFRFLWEYKGLGPGPHKIELTVVNDKNENSRGNWINFKEFTQTEYIPTFDARKMNAQVIQSKDAHKPILSLELSDIYGNKIHVCDFDSAGDNGEQYISWLNVLNAPKTDFSKANPLRSGRPDN